jgi:hypothetical protein
VVLFEIGFVDDREPVAIVLAVVHVSDVFEFFPNLIVTEHRASFALLRVNVLWEWANTFDLRRHLYLFHFRELCFGLRGCWWVYWNQEQSLAGGSAGGRLRQSSSAVYSLVNFGCYLVLVEYYLNLA